jgi:hypothetical protein
VGRMATTNRIVANTVTASDAVLAAAGQLNEKAMIML